jgi:DNA-binding NtrC family response regulator
MKQTILIIDDEAPIRELLQSYFSKQGYNVLGAGTAEEAVNLSLEPNLDLIILDVVLPDADGLDLLANFKKTRSDVPVVVMTGIGLDEILMKEAKQKGASGFVSKTMPLDKLLKEVQTLIELK